MAVQAGILVTLPFSSPFMSPPKSSRDHLPLVNQSASTDQTSSEADARVLRIARHIEAHAEAVLSLAELGNLIDLSPAYLQRQFKRVMGLSPRQYQEACRLRAIKSQLRNGESVTSALYEVGMGSSSRLYEKVDRHFGMTPSQYKAGGVAVNITYALADTLFGRLLMAATDRGLCLVSLGDDDAQLIAGLKNEFPKATIDAVVFAETVLTAQQTAMTGRIAQPEQSSPQCLRASQFQLWMTSLNAYLRASDSAALKQHATVLHELPLDMMGTAFQMKVWHYLQQIPRGSVQSYAAVAEAIGCPRAVRAVGTACGANRLALLIPCHRVIRGDGGLGGYRWGLARKQHLLQWEAGQNSRVVE